MKRYVVTILMMALGWCGTAPALQPDEIVVIANGDYAPSVQLARYYCQRRSVPAGHIVTVALGPKLRDSLGRSDYDQRLAGPVRAALTTRKDLSQIRCLVTTYGVPYKVGRREPLSTMEGRLKDLRQSLDQENDAIARLEAAKSTASAEYQQHQARLAEIRMDMDRITGRETDASVDSELSMILCTAYDLYRWQPNLLRGPEVQPFRTMMVSRLDGPSYEIARGLIDKAISAEIKPLAGEACIDSRSLFGNDTYCYYDESLRGLTLLTRLRTTLTVREESTPSLFPPGSCPQTALYCGWYNVRTYVDAFKFVNGAVGYHIASFEAVDLHDPNSPQWCPSLLMHGITATLGPVAEPYLPAFPEPKAFFGELFEGRCLVEAYYRTNPFNSWQMLLLGDPLYIPFRKPRPASGTPSP